MTYISIVIIGKNAEWSITRLLESVIAHVPSHYANEIIYVDSASTDGTLQAVSQYPVKSVCLTADRRLCASAGRFVGSQYATGTYITFLDSDMELLGGWLERAIRLLEQHREIAVVSGIQMDAESDVKVQPTGGHGGDRFTDTPFAGSAATFRREALESVGTWNPYIVSDEEPELCLRIRRAGYRIVQLQCPSVRHYGYSPPTIGTLLSRRRRRLFVGYGQVMRYHLRTGLLPAYLRERGWVVIPALVVSAGMIALLVTVLSENLYWAAGYLFVVLLAIAADALRSRSVYSAIFHVLHRALILEGTIRGFVRRPYPPNEYQHSARQESSSGDPICAA